MKSLRLLCLLAWFCCLPAALHAEYFEIEDYDVLILLRADAAIDVQETISVVFSQPRHGIFRKIPYVYEGGRWRRHYSTLLYDLAVSGHPFSTSAANGYRQIKIGSANRTVSGRQTYTLRYSVYGGIGFYNEHAEFYWNVIGTEWDVPIHHASFRVEAPGRTPLSSEDYFVYTGALGSRESDARVYWNGVSLEGQTTRSLSPHQGVTVGLKLPAVLISDNRTDLKMKLLFANYGMLLIPVGVLLLLFGVWWLWGRDEPIVEMVYYKPPAGITPAEVGVIIDDSTDNRDLSSLIVYWATQGIVSIDEQSGSGLLGWSKDYELSALAPLPSEAEPYERIIYDGLFLSRQSVLISELKHTFASTMGRARTLLDERIKAKGVYVKGTRGLRSVLMVVAAICIFLPFPIADAVAIVSGVLTALIVFLFARIMPKKTPSGRRLYQQVRGFREFVKRVEEPQLKLLLKENPMYFDQTIPYAMALGVAAQWAARFEGLMQTPPTWYTHNSGSFSSLSNFGSSLTQSCSSMGSVFSSSPSGSGGGGGGFSGGGGGGGGGGSW